MTTSTRWERARASRWFALVWVVPALLVLALVVVLGARALRDMPGVRAWLVEYPGAVPLPDDAPVETVLAHPAIYECVNQGLRSMRVNGSGSSMFASSALLMAEPPSAEAGEITDKGYINQRLVLNRRAALVNALYAEQHDQQVIQLTV